MVNFNVWVIRYTTLKFEDFLDISMVMGSNCPFWEGTYLREFNMLKK